MAREYKKVKHLLPEVLELVRSGKTQREIAEQFGLEKKHIRKLITRHNCAKRRAKEEMPNVRVSRGRPRKTPLTPHQDLNEKTNSSKWKLNCCGLFFELLEGGETTSEIRSHISS